MLTDVKSFLDSFFQKTESIEYTASNFKANEESITESNETAEAGKDKWI
jgi:hypothetical protein